MIGLVDRFLQDEKASLDNMILDPIQSVEPLDLADDGKKELPASISLPITSSSPSQPAVASSSSIFKAPRRRAQSDEPAINETRMLNLPDYIAEIRDNMRGMIGRRVNRIKTMKLVAAFNEDMASAIESFASNLKSQLERSPYQATLIKKSEGASILSAWDSAMRTFEAYARNAEVLSRKIRSGNEELQKNISFSERGAKTFQEREEIRWKSLCDTAKIESKAKVKHQQYLLDLQKARARLTSVEEGRVGGGGDDNIITPRKSAQSKKIDKHVNKAMGKMFSILPGGGEEVMNKMLTPQQRLAIAARQLDEAEGKEGKGTESFETARSVKEQSVASYTTEAEAAELKFKSEERYEWNMVQTSLLCSVDAMKKFRDGQLKSVTSAISTKDILQERALDDVGGCAVLTEKRVKDYRDQCVDERKDDSRSQFGDGFCLRVQLVECTDVQKTLRYFLVDNNDDDGLDDMMGREDIVAESPSQEVNSDTSELSTPLLDAPTDSVIGKMEPIFSKTLSNVSIEEYYISGWSEETPLYERWLKRKGSFDITVGDWEHSPDEGFENAWSGETFPQKRVSHYVQLGDFYRFHSWLAMFVIYLS